MSLSSALGAALSGLKASQNGLGLVAANVSNADTPGYTRKTLVTEQAVAGGVTIGVRSEQIRRELDTYIQRQLRTETAGDSYARTRAGYLDRLQGVFGAPGDDQSLDALTADFSASIDALAASPDDGGARSAVIQQAQLLAQKLNDASADVQDLRGQADQTIADGVDKANEALRSIETLTDQIVSANASGHSTAALLDQRDAAIDTVSGLIDVRVEDLGGGEIRVKTQGGVSLYDGSASTLSFTPTATMTADARYSADPTERTIGTITLTRPSGYSVDLLANGQLRSGELRALADLRDKSLPQAQTQLDELAANLAQALGSRSVPGAAIAGGVALSTAGAQAGDRMTVNYASGGTTRSVTIVNVGDPTQLPLPNALTPDPNDTVVGVDFSSPAAAADIDAALAAAGVSITASATADGFSFASGALTISDGASRITATALSGDGLALPLFTDGVTGPVYSGSLDGGDQRAGFASRIAVSAKLVADPTALTSYASGTAAGDAARPAFLQGALARQRSFLSDTGLGGASSPYKGTIADFAAGTIDFQARASASATRVADGQSLVVSSLTDRLSASSGVDVDQEMGHLIQLQTAYSANARVVTAVKEMLDMLLRV